MLKAYKFVQTDHQKLHGYVIAFFNRIEYETGQFSLDFFDEKFKPIVKRHRKILKSAFEDIYNELKQWSQSDRSQLCLEIRQSNEIERICARDTAPRKFSDTDAAIYKSIKALFINLYSSVLDGNVVHDVLGIALKEHFKAIRKANNDITLCPMCGISELKTEYDDARDQYDHYLPKAIYPLSSINFHNLVLICKECNSFDVKGEKDILSLTANKLFYPYDENHKGIDVEFSIQNDDKNIANIDWAVSLKSRDGKDQEVEAWKGIFNIESRYVGFVKGRIAKWYSAYWGYSQDKALDELSSEQKKKAYLASMGADETECLNVIRKPAFLAFLASGWLVRAEQEAQNYS